MAGISFLATTTPILAFNKANKIIIKIDNKDSTQMLNMRFPKNIVQDINHYLQAKSISNTNIYMAEKIKAEI